jgi:thioredoxin reductase
MSSDLWDLITIGAGPAGLMCAVTAASGVPIEPPRPGRMLVVDKGAVGQFARFGKLRLTHRWHLMGDALVRNLEAEARVAGIRLHEHEAVVGVDLAGETKLVETTKGAYRTRALALCPGFFPHGGWMRHGDGVRPVFSPASLEARVLGPRPDERLVVVGGGPSTPRFAADLAAARPEAAVTVVVEDEDGTVDLTAAAAAGLDARRGRVEVVDARRGAVTLAFTAPGGAPVELRGSILLVDYNSYTTATEVTSFLAATPLERRAGYLVTDPQGRTSVPGVVAAGNVTTAVSGALTALSTGFVAGIAIHLWLAEQGGTAPELFPWLPREGLAAHPLAGGRLPGW